MITLHRIAVPLINAFFITAVLIYLMFALIKSDQPELSLKEKISIIDWVRIPEESEVETLHSKPPKPPEVKEAPSAPLAKLVVDIGEIDSGPYIPFKVERTGKLPTIANSQLIRIFGQPGNYPQRAITGGIEGYVVVGFSVNEAGAVFDPFVIEAEPEGVFERSALKAISKFKYKARVVNDKAVSSDGQRYMFSYKLDS